MSRVILTLLTLFFPISIHANNNTITFKGYFKDRKDSLDNYRVYMYNNVTRQKDSAIIHDGAFEINCDFIYPSRYLFYTEFELRKSGGFLPLAILVDRPGRIEIQASSNSFATSAISGAEANKILEGFLKELAEKLSVVVKDKKLQDSLKQQSTAFPLQTFLKPQYDKLLSQYPNSYATAYILDKYSLYFDLSTRESFYNSLGQEGKTMPGAVDFLKRLDTERKNLAGNLAFLFALPDSNNIQHRLEEYKGKYILLDFWESTCYNCFVELQHLKEIQAKYEKNGLIIISISMDTEKEAWLRMIRQEKMKWLQLFDKQGAESIGKWKYGVREFPSIFLIDNEGKIIASKLKGPPLDAILERIFAVPN
ncbi:peroxiredoxin family protein [Chitinophaga niabensis]|uniref:Peroxiredoxin n=1 Tax=Chitinophaga niabensis TaxID=536979 RepID=A0A1N6HHQ7_9BACT|nr:TlpA disulfide reductase family protein [Chitinophaga niabensis]SIO19273.1 Peroxiredoxin [Chitinophaga niabensis]